MKVRAIKALNIRIGKPSVNAPCNKFYKRGTVFDVEEATVNGDFYEGNSIWYTDKLEQYYWSGAIIPVEEEELAEYSNQIAYKNVTASALTEIKLNESESVSPGASYTKEKDPPILNEPVSTKNALQVSSVNYKKLCDYIKDYKIEKIWETTRGREVTVSILDSGLNYNNQAFSNRLTTTYFNACINSEMRADCLDNSSGHGTDCATILCGSSSSISGVSPDITLNVIKVTNDDGTINTLALARGLEKAIEAKPDIIAMCYFIPIDRNIKKIQQLIEYASKRNIIIVGAVGNQGSYKFPVNNYPASFSECISVGSLNEKRLRDSRSSRSDFLNLMAPGKDLVSDWAWKMSKDNTGYATAFATGVIALLLSLYKSRGKEITVKGFYELLYKYSYSDFPEYNPLEYGWGIINPLAYSNAISSASAPL